MLEQLPLVDVTVLGLVGAAPVVRHRALPIHRRLPWTRGASRRRRRDGLPPAAGVVVGVTLTLPARHRRDVYTWVRGGCRRVGGQTIKEALALPSRRAVVRARRQTTHNSARSVSHSQAASTAISGLRKVSGAAPDKSAQQPRGAARPGVVVRPNPLVELASRSLNTAEPACASYSAKPPSTEQVARWSSCTRLR